MNLHAEIMNIPSDRCMDFKDANHAVTYKIGHKDARHAAAELALKQDVVIDDFYKVCRRALLNIYGDTWREDMSKLLDKIDGETK